MINMELKRITISEVEGKIKELRTIDKALDNKIKVVIVLDNMSLRDIDDTLNKEIVELAKEHLNEKRTKIIEELQENGIVEHSIEPLKK